MIEVTKTGFEDALPQISITTQQGTFTVSAPEAVNIARQILVLVEGVHTWERVDPHDLTY